MAQKSQHACKQCAQSKSDCLIFNTSENSAQTDYAILETMEYHKYASIPMLNKSGEYVGTITEGDLLWGIKRYTNLNLKEAENIFIQDFPRKVDYVAVSINSDMEDLLQKAMNQNFVPVVDDQKKFIGIVTRKSIMEYCYEKLKNLPEDY